MKRRKSTGKARKTRSKKGGAIPDPRTVVSETNLRSRSGKTYRLIRTTQTDPYDAPLRPSKG